jgi:PBSX family phage terminase large subunit
MIVQSLVAKQIQSYRLADARLNIWDGTVRSSKTITSLLRWIEFVKDAPPGNLLMVGKTERTLRRNIIDVMVDMLGRSRCKLIAGSGELWLLGRRIYLCGAADERAQEKIRGLSLQGAYCDELTTYPESFFSMLLTRLSGDGIHPARCYGTTNPDGPRHWLKINYLDKAKLHLTLDGELRHSDDPDALDLHRFSFQLKDNPALSPDYVKALEKEFVGLWRKRFILGMWVLAEGSVYDMFDPEVHVVDEIPTITRYVALAVDYGTRNPFHAGLIGLGVDRKLYVMAEWRHDSLAAFRQMSDTEYATAIQDWLASIPIPGTSLRGVRPEWTCVDPSAASFIVELYNRGITAAKANNDVLDGIRLISSLFTNRQLLIHRSCRWLVDELVGYCWDDKAAMVGEDKPIKQADHGPDMLRYGLLTTQALWQGQIAA